MSMRVIKKKFIEKNKPFIIAEVSGNHGGSLKRMLKIVDAVAKTGADAIKLQTLKPDNITLNCNSKEFTSEVRGFEYTPLPFEVLIVVIVLP